jgi:hypothetical protein
MVMSQQNLNDGYQYTEYEQSTYSSKGYTVPKGMGIVFLDGQLLRPFAVDF